jgi:hypothetical protein
MLLIHTANMLQNKLGDHLNSSPAVQNIYISFTFPFISLRLVENLLLLQKAKSKRWGSRTYFSKNSKWCLGSNVSKTAKNEGKTLQGNEKSY